MPVTMKIDQLNTLKSAGKSSFDDYFDPMELPKYEKNRRKRIAMHIEEMMLAWFYFYVTLRDTGVTDREYLVQSLRNRFKRAIIDDVVIDSFMEQYLDEISEELVDSTLRHSEDTSEIDSNNEIRPVDEVSEDYYISPQRAEKIAQNEANRIANHEQFEECILSGYTMKKWHTMEDERVRHTHKEVDMQAIPIDEPFIVGGYAMMYPMDTQFGASDREIIGCRCSAEYIK